MPWKEISQLSRYTKLMTLLGLLIFTCLVFALGIDVGYNRAIFASGWDANYMKNMSRLQTVIAPFFHDNDNLNSHGAIGNITSVNLPTIIVHGANQAEQIILLSSSTVIRNQRFPGNVNDLNVGDQVIVIGAPDSEGRIAATFIRIVNEPPIPSPLNGSPFPKSSNRIR